jgi:hypothetical protein
VNDEYGIEDADNKENIALHADVRSECRTHAESIRVIAVSYRIGDQNFFMKLTFSSGHSTPSMARSNNWL